ncbi:extracellular solute-binding protein [Lachnospiraceae bacterium ZAX-1]
MKNINKRQRYTVAFLLSFVLIATILNSCAGNKAKPDPKNPVTVTVWHYYNGTVLEAFHSLVQTFNETVGMKKGIIVEDYGYGSVSELEKAVLASANNEVGCMPIPNIFASYTDTVYATEEMGILANLDDYFPESEQQTYLSSYIEEGKIGQNGELRIFPIAKATEAFMLNDTDWAPFAQAHNLSYSDLSTLESLVSVSKLYYDWTNAQTPDVRNDGKAFFGRDSIANMFIIGSMEFGEEIFQVENGKGHLNINEDVMRKLWDCYYVPYISGYFSSYGRYRSDDVKVGELLAYVGSTSSSDFFPEEVSTDGTTYPITAKILPVPHFEHAKKVLVQQGAGMAVTKASPQMEFASAEFLKWFTDIDNNTIFSALSGYMPVKKQAADYKFISEKLEEQSQSISTIVDETLQIVLADMADSTLYTNKAFRGGAEARGILETNLQDKAIADREAILALMERGTDHDDAVFAYATNENFKAWLADITSKLERAVD